jgi:hypothetical protein
MEFTPSGFCILKPDNLMGPGLKDLGFRLNLFAESEAEETIHGDGVTELFALGFK